MKKICSLSEKNQFIKLVEIVLLVLMTIGSAVCFIYGTSKISIETQSAKYIGQFSLLRDTSLEDYDENCKSCDVTYKADDGQMILSFAYDEYIMLNSNIAEAYKYETADGIKLYFNKFNPSEKEIASAYKQRMANELMPIFNGGIALLILTLSLSIVYFFSQTFTTYEKIWFLSIMVLATIFAIIFPEESANGVNGIVIMMLYLLDTFLNILCELLISKQSRYNFLVSVLVEITEILVCVVLMYRFATMTTTLFFWLPIDILSFINWSKHKDENEEELTVVRKLKGYQELLVIVGIIVWTLLVGYLISGLDIKSDFIKDKNLETVIAYIDACASAVGVANGLFIFFRLQEQWIAWYICAILEAIINVISGQYVLLVLKLGYITNTTYGYIKWNKYIKSHHEKQQSIF